MLLLLTVEMRRVSGPNEDVLCRYIGGLPGPALCSGRRRLGNHSVQDRRQLPVIHEQLRQSDPLRVPVGAVSQEHAPSAAVSAVRLTVPEEWRWDCHVAGNGRQSLPHSSRDDGQRSSTTDSCNTSSQTPTR